MDVLYRRNSSMSFRPLEFVWQICHEILWDVSGGSVNMVSLEVIILDLGWRSPKSHGFLVGSMTENLGLTDM